MNVMGCVRIVVATAAAAALVPIASAQSANTQGDIALPGAPAVSPSTETPATDQFGGNYFIKIIPGADIVPTNSTSTYAFSGSGYFTSTAGGIFWTAIDMEPGTEVAQVCTFAFDNSATGSLSVQWGIYHMGDATGLPGFINIGTAATGAAPVPNYVLLCTGPGPVAPFKFRAFADVDADGTPDYNWHRLSISVPAVDANIRWGGAYVQWRRSISTAPATATFPNDVPTTHGLYRFVEALAAAGITGGCGPGAYCPDSPITRGQMAVFLTAGLGLYWPN